MEKDIYERILILQEPRPIIETLKYTNQHKKLLESVLLDKLKLDGEVELEEEAATEEIIRGYKALRENNDLGVFVLPIRLEVKFDFHALADIAKVKKAQGESDSDDEEDYCVKRDETGKPIYGLNFAKYLNCDDPMDCALALLEALNMFRKICDGDGKWHVVIDDELMTKKIIKFRLGGRGHTLTLLEFARRLSLYHSAEISDEGFEVYFQQGLRSDENFNAREYRLSISSEEELHLSRSLASTIRSLILRHQNGYTNVAWLIARWLKKKGVGSQRDSMICCGQFITRIARRSGLLADEEGSHGDSSRRELERMARKQLYHTDRYAGVFKYMVGHYNVPLQGDYAPPSYFDEQQLHDEE
ncbi:hypothetical protein Tco_1540907 [Tanacetum coccineum]